MLVQVLRWTHKWWWCCLFLLYLSLMMELLSPLVQLQHNKKSLHLFYVSKVCKWHFSLLCFKGFFCNQLFTKLKELNYLLKSRPLIQPQGFLSLVSHLIRKWWNNPNAYWRSQLATWDRDGGIGLQPAT